MQTCIEQEQKHTKRKNSRLAFTTLKESSTEEQCTSTQKVAIELIKLPKEVRIKELPLPPPPREQSISSIKKTDRNVNDHPNFEFEKKRLKELGDEQISRYKLDGPVAEIDQQDPRVIRLTMQNEAAMTKETGAIDRLSFYLKTLSVAMTVWGVIGVVFSLIYTFVIALCQQTNILRNAIPMVINIVESVWLISIALRGGNIASITDPESESISRHIKFTIATVAALFIQFIVMPCVQSITACFNSLGDVGLGGDSDDAVERRGTAFTSLGYVVVWISTLLNCGVCIASLALTITLRKYVRLRHIHTLEQKTLPIGYQVYPVTLLAQ